jgi:hypothetical protein
MDSALIFSHIGFLSFIPTFILSVFIPSFVYLVSFIISFFPSPFYVGWIDKMQATWNSETGALQVQQSIYYHVF